MIFHVLYIPIKTVGLGYDQKNEQIKLIGHYIMIDGMAWRFWEFLVVA